MGTGKRARHVLEELAVRGVLSMLRRLPTESALTVGALMGRAAFSVLRVRRRTTRDNLASTLGGSWGSARLDAVGRDSYENFGRSIMEFSRFPLIDRAYIERFITFEGLENLDHALTRGKGVIFITGHFGSWELMGAALSLIGYPMNFLVGEQHNLRVDRMMNDLRRSRGIGVISRGMGLREALRKLRQNEVIALLADQDVGRRGLMIDFLGRAASTPRGPVALALKTGAVMIPAAMVRTRGPYHRVVIRPEIPLVSRGEGHEQALSRHTQAHADVLAEFIRRYPEMWFWPHRRWKTRPRGRGELEERDRSAA